MNAGSVDGSSTEPSTTALVTYTGGDYNASTNVYTAPVGANMTEAIVGRFMSVYVDGDTTPTTNQYLVGRITAVNTGTRAITIAAGQVFLGTEVSTGTGNRSARIGGAWAGPSGTVAFPFGFVGAGLFDASANRPRVNIKNDQTYNITATMSLNQIAGPVKWQGYSNTYGDGSKATFDGGTSGASYILLAVANANQHWFEDLIFQNNGATGSVSLVATTIGGNAQAWFRRCVFAHSRGHGLDLSLSVSTAIECEAYDCNQSNSSNLAGFNVSAAGSRVIRCISHDHGTPGNAGDNVRHGYVTTASVFLINSIADSCGGSGIRQIGNGGSAVIKNCDLYNNGGDGYVIVVGGGIVNLYIENSNFIKNGGYGVNLVDASTMTAFLANNGFGSGSMTNASGQTNIATGTDFVEVVGSVTYASGATPWVDPDNGDFRITLGAAKSAGRGQFLQTTGSAHAGTVGYPDIGAAFHHNSD